MKGLKELGLTGYEASIYSTLLDYGKLTAKELSDRSNVPPTAVYPNVESLVKKGLIQKLTGKIATFEALPPKIGLRSWVRKKAARIIELEKELIPVLEQKTNQKRFPTAREPIFLSSGVQASHEISMGFMDEAKKSLFVVGWAFRSDRNMYSLLKGLKAAVQRKVDVRLILPRKEKSFEKVKSICKEYGIKAKYCPLQNFSIVICDGTECKITLKGVELPERVNMKIQDNDLGRALEEYFLVLWKKAEQI
ncbi:MAG: helix-turn-helix domain-containing protein [Nanoarchaeota archaeon]